jgi:hypothetical protein
MIARYRDCSSPPNFPFDVLDADLLSRLLVVVKPFPFAQIDTCKLRPRVGACSLPITLARLSHRMLAAIKRLTSGLNSVNSSPRQSISTSFCGFAGSDCSYAAGTPLMVALDSRSDNIRAELISHLKSVYLAVLTSPDEVGFAPAARLVVHVLRIRESKPTKACAPTSHSCLSGAQMVSDADVPT